MGVTMRICIEGMQQAELNIDHVLTGDIAAFLANVFHRAARTKAWIKKERRNPNLPDDATFIADYYALTQAAMAEKYRVTLNVVQNYRRTLGLTAKRPQDRAKRRPPVEAYKRIIRESHSYAQVQAILETLGYVLSIGTITNDAKAMKVTPLCGLPLKLKAGQQNEPLFSHEKQCAWKPGQEVQTRRRVEPARIAA